MSNVNKVGQCIDNLIILTKLKDKEGKIITLKTDRYHIRCSLEDEMQFQRADSQIPQTGKVRVFYTTETKPQGYYEIAFLVFENGKLIELNFQNHRQQYYGYIERVD